MIRRHRIPSRPAAIVVLVLASLAMAAGCAGPAIRSQSPEIEALAHLEEGTKLVGDYTAPWGLAAKRIEAAALACWPTCRPGA
jgi:hypothetical protein